MIKIQKKNPDLAYLTIPFSKPPAITLIDTPSGWLEKATEQMISLQWTCPTRSPFTVHSLRSLPPPAKTPNSPEDHQDILTAQEHGPPMAFLRTMLTSIVMTFLGNHDQRLFKLLQVSPIETYICI